MKNSHQESFRLAAQTVNAFLLLKEKYPCIKKELGGQWQTTGQQHLYAYFRKFNNSLLAQNEVEARLKILQTNLDLYIMNKDISHEVLFQLAPMTFVYLCTKNMEVLERQQKKFETLFP